MSSTLVGRPCDSTHQPYSASFVRVKAPSTTGRSANLNCVFDITRLFIVPPGAFRPAPKVDSAVARLVPLRERAPRIADPARFERIVAAAFSQRRKTLRNALSQHLDAAALVAAGVDPGVRGETLSVGDFVRLAAAAPA